MCGVDLLDQRVAAYRLDHKSRFHFYLLIFFDLLDIACTNAFIVFNRETFVLLYFKVNMAQCLIRNYSNRVRGLRHRIQANIATNYGQQKNHNIFENFK